MNNAINFIRQYITPIENLMNAIIVIVALIFIGLLIIKAIGEIRKDNWPAGFKKLGGALVIFIVASASVVGVIKIANMIKPDAVGNNNQFRAAAIQPVHDGYLTSDQVLDPVS